MREIIFRGKRVDNGEWVYGDLIHWWGKHNTKPDIQIYNNVQRFNVIPETISEFTGICDKNGKKIFEGDVLIGAWNTVCQVVYDDCYLGFRAKEKDGLHRCIDYYGDYYGLDCIEVIGNIHDNPELIGGGENA